MRQHSIHRLAAPTALGTALALGAAGPLLADEGRIEINQAAAEAGGVTPGDAPGFPVELYDSGSYVLTGNLTVTDADTDAIQLLNHHITVDLNGFRISGPVVCSGTPGSISCGGGTGRGLVGLNDGLVVHDGSVSGFAGDGVRLGEEARVIGVHARRNGGDGIGVGPRSQVTASRAVFNAGGGLELGDESSVVDSAALDNNGMGIDLGVGSALSGNLASGNAGGSARGGIPLDDNLCDGVPCPASLFAEVDSIYVSESDPSASDAAGCGRGPTGSGPGNHPCASINAGLVEAVAATRTKVRIANGFYLESLTLVSGIDILGGHDPQYWQQNTAATATVVRGNTSPGTHDKTLVAENIGSPTLVEGLVIEGETNAASGGNSYAVYIAETGSALTIRNSRIVAGVGGPGAYGGDGPPGAAPGDGAVGGSWVDSGTDNCSGTLVIGGSGGSSSCSADGGSGATAVCPVGNNRQASGSAGAGGGAGGGGGYDWQSTSTCNVGTGGQPNEGQPGSDGEAGSAGAGGAGCSSPSGSVLANEWVGATAGTGSPGVAGGGGGGGGAGGGLDDNDGCSYTDQLGGAGGGGGAGGCGGAGGIGGFPGGGAFAIFVTFASASSDLPVLSGNEILGGSGGAGGSGGSGGVGAPGGDGGSGGAIGGPFAFALGSGGKGGAGGRGGDAGGGGGGCGGPAYGIYVHNHAVAPGYGAGNAFGSTGTGGAGGAGGLSWAGPGSPGAAGTGADVNF